MDLYKRFQLEKLISINDCRIIQQPILLVIALQYSNGIHCPLMYDTPVGNLYPVLINEVKQSK